MEGGGGPPWPLDTSHTNRLGQELPESVRAAPVTRRGGRLLQQLNKGQLLLVGLNVNFSPGALSVWSAMLVYSPRV